MLLYAFIGGLILNVMPCVLPVIALKILGFVSESKSEPRHLRKLGLLYALGVLVSFLALAALVLAVKAAGHQAGWGMQFSNPQFIIGLTTVVTLVALNLFGVFEVNVSGRMLGTAGNLASRSGSAGAFFNGVLATLLATPCTAPILGTALGFAFTQSAPIVILIFTTIAAGLAAPYVILSWQPAWLKFLPKPGAWMEQFKIAMGFPMLATALWLFSLTTIYYGERSWWLAVFLVFVSAAAWGFGVFVQRGNSRRGLALGVVLAVLAAGYVWALDGQLRWRSPIKDASGEVAPTHAPEGYAWQPWSAEAVTKARAEGRPVVVDFTAKWCLTCNISVAPAFETKAVIEKLKQLNAVALVADYTRYAPEITKELARFNRTGVPLVLVYPADASQPTIVLNEPLPYPASYAPTLLDALSHAAP
jgi:thiol:disulfide interchange protein DsbD